MTRLARNIVGAALVAASLAACSSDRGVGPKPDTVVHYDLQLASPNEADAGALLHFTGPVDSVTAPAGSVRVIPVERIQSGSASSSRYVLAGSLHSGSIATVWSHELAAQPQAELEQVSAAVTLAQRALTGYAVALVRSTSVTAGR